MGDNLIGGDALDDSEAVDGKLLGSLIGGEINQIKPIAVSQG